MLVYTPTLPTDSKQEKSLLAALGLKNKYDKLEWPLPNLKEVKDVDFWSHSMSWTPEADVYVGQRMVDGKWYTMRLYFVDHGQYIGGGFAVLFSHAYKEEEVRYFTWRACDHVFKSRTTGRCLTLYTCEKCKASYEVDSSD